MHDLDALDASYVAEVLSKPPFVTVPGVINVRDLGLLPSATFPGKITRPRHLYRSAELSGILPEGSFVNRFQSKSHYRALHQERHCLKN
jgi:hypothetical protein